MPKITFIETNGQQHQYDAAGGQTLMQIAVFHNVPGLPAECGGACACGTCQVLVDETWAAKLPPAQAMEQSIVDEEDHTPGLTRRLSCQIEVTDSLDGLTVQIPERLY